MIKFQVWTIRLNNKIMKMMEEKFCLFVYLFIDFGAGETFIKLIVTTIVNSVSQFPSTRIFFNKKFN